MKVAADSTSVGLGGKRKDHGQTDDVYELNYSKLMAAGPLVTELVDEDTSVVSSATPGILPTSCPNALTGVSNTPKRPKKH